MKYDEIEDLQEYAAMLLEDEMAELRHHEREHRDNGGGNPSQLVRMAVNAAVVRILNVGVTHDYQDVLAYGVEGVLSMYGIVVPLTEVAQKLLRTDLVSLGEREQTHEITRLSMAGENDLQLGLGLFCTQ